jgi:hypothetical protein
MVFLKEKNTLTIITNGCKGVFAKITACRQCAWGPQVTYSRHYFFLFLQTTTSLPFSESSIT